MGADRWSACPQCAAKLTNDANAARKTADDAYGKLPRDEWQALEDLAVKAKALADDPPCEMREDFEVGGLEGEPTEWYVVCNYGASCQACGFSVTTGADGVTIDLDQLQ